MRRKQTVILVTLLILVLVELSVPKGPCHIREQMGERLCVIPDMSTGASTATGAVHAAFPRPESAVRLTLNRWRLQYGKIGGDGFHELALPYSAVVLVGIASYVTACVVLRHGELQEFRTLLKRRRSS